MACITGGMFGVPVACIPGTETAVAAASTPTWILPMLFIIAVMYFETQKGETEWPIDVDAMEDEE